MLQVSRNAAQHSEDLLAVAGPVVYVERARVGRPDDFNTGAGCGYVFLGEEWLLLHDDGDS